MNISMMWFAKGGVTLITIDEMEIIKSALEGDIIRQKTFLNEMAAEGGSDIRFEMWLDDTEILYKKIRNKLFDMKADQAKESL